MAPAGGEAHIWAPVGNASAMYHLRVIHPGSSIPTEIVSLERASDVLTHIPQLLTRHTACERIEVMARTTPLFAVDCKGQRLER